MTLATLPTRNSTAIPNAGKALLRELIDYAGLFPPAAFAMAPAVANYDTYLRSEWNWMLGRFVIPVARLSEFEQAFASLPAIENGTANWRLSVLPGPDPFADLASIQGFNARMAGANAGRNVVIDSAEIKVGDVAEIIRLATLLPREIAVYFEVPLAMSRECIMAISDCGRRAKIRTGGETADKFPAAHSVVEFIHLCSASHVPFKATAGLHHPLRSQHPFTYRADSPSGMMHGFLNVFLAASFLRAGMSIDVAVELLEEQSAEAIRLDSDAVSWRGYRISVEEIAVARRDFAVSFGSCSFTEPVDDLRSLRLL